MSAPAVPGAADPVRSAVRSAVHRILREPFTRRAWTDLGYVLVSFPMAIAGFLFTVPPFALPVLLLLPRLESAGSLLPAGSWPAASSVSGFPHRRRCGSARMCT